MVKWSTCSQTSGCRSWTVLIKHTQYQCTYHTAYNCLEKRSFTYPFRYFHKKKCNWQLCQVWGQTIFYDKDFFQQSNPFIWCLSIFLLTYKIDLHARPVLQWRDLMWAHEIFRSRRCSFISRYHKKRAWLRLI